MAADMELYPSGEAQQLFTAALAQAARGDVEVVSISRKLAESVQAVIGLMAGAIVTYEVEAQGHRAQTSHVTEPIIGRLRMAANKEIGDFPNSATNACIEALRTALKTLRGGERGASVPRRDVEAWLKARRDSCAGSDYMSASIEAAALDDALDDFRLHMQTGTPLTGHVCDGGCHPGTCPAVSA